MMKKFMVGAAVGTAGLVALTGATFAQADGENPASGVRDRVAEILGIAPEELDAAMQQARDEQRDAQIEERLSYSVENGVITQEEADAILAWLEAKPASLDEVGAHGGHGVLGHFVQASASEERITAIVERLVAGEKITEEEAVEVTAWLSSAPTEALSKLGGGFGDGDHGRGRDHGGFGGRMQGRGPGGGLFEGRFELRPYSPPADSGSTDDGVNTTTSAAVSGDVI